MPYETGTLTEARRHSPPLPALVAALGLVAVRWVIWDWRRVNRT